MGTKFRKDVENSLKRFLKGKAKITLGFVVAFLITGTAGYALEEGIYKDDIISEINGTAIGGAEEKTFTFEGNVTLNNKSNNPTVWVSENGNITLNIANGKTMSIENINNSLANGLEINKTLQTERAKLTINGGDLRIKLGISGGDDTFALISDNNGDLTIKNKSITIESADIGIKMQEDSNVDIETGDFSIKNSHQGIAMQQKSGNGINKVSINSGNNINITSKFNEKSAGIYLLSYHKAGLENELNLTTKNKINIAAEKYGIHSYGKNKISLFANDIEISSNNSSIYSVGVLKENNKYNSFINLNSTNKIEIRGTEYGIYSYSGENTESKVNLNSANIILNSKWAICSMKENSTVTLDSLTSEITGTLYASDSGKINLNSSQNTIMSNITAKGSGAVTIENSLNDVTGNILAETNGKVSLDLTDGKLTGKVNDSRLGNTTSGTVKLNLDNGTWESIGKGSVTEVNLNNSGNIKFTDNASSVDIQNLKGKGNGTFAMNVNSEDKSSGNMIYVQNSEGGTYQIDLQNSDLSKIKVGDKIRFATIGENAKNSNLEFTVLDVKERGIRDVSFTVDYEDFEKGNTENGTYNDGTNKSGNEYVETNYENGENWYLTREENSVPAPNPDPDTDKPTTDPDESINDIGISIIEMARANYSSAVYMDNLNKRLGDMSFAEGNSGLWVRMRNDRVGEDKEYRLHNNMAQIGYDKIYNLENGKEHRGIAFDYADGQMEYKNLKGESDIDRYTVSFYDTRVYNNGVYADYTARAGYMTSDFEVYGRETGNQVKGDYDNLVLGVGAEFGKRYNFGETSYFEPQIQLQYTYIDDTDYTTNQDTKVNYDEIHSLIGRAGIRVGHDFYKENSKDNTVYLKFDMNHEFLGDQDVKASDVTGTLNKTYENDNTWYDIGIGGAKNLTENLYVYADMERQFGEERDNSWQFNLGFRYKFGSLKDFTFNTANLFDFDKSEVKPAGKEMIKNASEIINKKNLKGTLLIEGHTDWTGSEEYNQLLSEKRARAVQEVFEENVTNENIKYETKGYGETKPKADNRTSEGRAENRRVEINYVK